MNTPTQPDARSVNIFPLLNDTDILRSLSERLGDFARSEKRSEPHGHLQGLIFQSMSPSAEPVGN
jgi:hypothetical protein